MTTARAAQTTYDIPEDRGQRQQGSRSRAEGRGTTEGRGGEEDGRREDGRRERDGE
jgi:hypothetical protein